MLHLCALTSYSSDARVTLAMLFNLTYLFRADCYKKLEYVSLKNNRLNVLLMDVMISNLPRFYHYTLC